ncbi:MAG: OmpH family outer membrane protein [Saprospiraceae bacterium]|jgi:outer membrane protein|nr:OmpH family outer membrane protein [Saprospiraceae bacterium]
MKWFFALVFSALLSTGLSAQKFAYVDIDKILNGMDDYQKAQTDLDNIASKWKQEIAQEYDKIKGMYNKYQAEQVLLSEDARKQREEEITQKEKEVRDLQKQKFGTDGALFQKRQELVKPIQERVYSAIERYANEKGYDFIFDKGTAGIIFSGAKFDLTEDISKALSKK